MENALSEMNRGERSAVRSTSTRILESLGPSCRRASHVMSGCGGQIISFRPSAWAVAANLDPLRRWKEQSIWRRLLALQPS